MRSHIQLQNKPRRELPEAFRQDDVRYADELVALFLEEYTRPGEVVFDPFAGYGTTLVVAEALGRHPYGLEWDAGRVEYIRTQLRRPEAIVQGDARRLCDYGLPQLDFSMTSPPYMQRGDPEDPLSGYAAPGGGYERYLAELAGIYAELRQLMRPGGRVVIEASNLKGAHGVTPLAWDIAAHVGQVLRFEGEVVVGWDSYGYGYEHSYCLIFQADEVSS